MPNKVELDWNQIIEILKQKIPSASFNTWFKHTNLESIDGDDVVVGVASHFIKERLQAHYASLISDSFSEAGLKDVRITFKVTSEPFKKLREEQEAARKAVTVLPSMPIPRPGTGRARHFESRLNSQFTFDKFIPGPSNQIALGACLRIVEAPAEFNPLTITGESGLGKTHLLQAVCHEIQKRDKDRKVIYLSCEAFANQFLKSVINKDRPAFQSIFRNCDLLILDDIQFLTRGNKEATQEELLHTFDTLVTAGKQVVISCDVDPRLMQGLMPKLAKRFISGFTVKLEGLTQGTSVAMVKRRAIARRLEIDDEIAELIVSRIEPCGREIDGAITRLAAISSIMGSKITRELVAQLFDSRPEEESKDFTPISVEDILDAAAEVFGVCKSDILGRKRSYRIKDARKVGMIIARQISGASFAEIGQVFGKRSHSTVLLAVKDGEKYIQSSETLKARAEEIRSRFPRAQQQKLIES